MTCQHAHAAEDPKRSHYGRDDAPHLEHMTCCTCGHSWIVWQPKDPKSARQIRAENNYEQR